MNRCTIDPRVRPRWRGVRGDYRGGVFDVEWARLDADAARDRGEPVAGLSRDGQPGDPRRLSRARDHGPAGRWPGRARGRHARRVSDPVRGMARAARWDGDARRCPSMRPRGSHSRRSIPRKTERGSSFFRVPSAGPPSCTSTASAACAGACRRVNRGETCPPGWDCDEGLDCELPVGVCGPLAGTGTCVPKPTYCQRRRRRRLWMRRADLFEPVRGTHRRGPHSREGSLRSVTRPQVHVDPRRRRSAVASGVSA